MLGAMRICSRWVHLLEEHEWPEMLMPSSMNQPRENDEEDGKGEIGALRGGGKGKVCADVVSWGRVGCSGVPTGRRLTKGEYWWGAGRGVPTSRRLSMGECWRWLGSADESSAFQRGVPTGRWLAGGLGLQGVQRSEGVEVAALAVEGDFFVPALSEGVAEGGAV